MLPQRSYDVRRIKKGDIVDVYYGTKQGKKKHWYRGKVLTKSRKLLRIRVIRESRPRTVRTGEILYAHPDEVKKVR